MSQFFKKYKILIVDDNPVFVKALRDLIIDVASNKIKYIETAFTGLDGLNKMSEVLYDLIFMDIDLPDISGINLTRIIDRNNIAQRVIAVSFHKEIEYMEKMLGAGARHYISKDCINADSLAAIFI